jgi:hypothetical protein
MESVCKRTSVTSRLVKGLVVVAQLLGYIKIWCTRENFKTPDALFRRIFDDKNNLQESYNKLF